MLWILTACTSSPPQPTPTPEPPPPVASSGDPVVAWRSHLGTMARDDEAACKGITAATKLVHDAKDDPALTKRLEGTPGFRATSSGSVAVDWVELSQASGGGALEVALVTIGGVEAATRRDCLKVESLGNWLSRAPAFTKLRPCTQEAARTALADILAPLPARSCICGIPKEDTLPRVERFLTQIGIDPSPFKTWDAQPGWKACPVKEP